MQKFNISEATFYRIRRAVFREEKNVPVGLSLDTLLENFVLCDKRLAAVAELAKNLAHDKNIAGVDRVNALHLAASYSLDRPYTLAVAWKLHR